MDEVTHLCDRVVIIDRGRVIDGGTPAELVRRHFPRRTVEFSTKDEIDLDMVLVVPSVDEAEVDRVDGSVRVRCHTSAPDTALRELLAMDELADARDVQIREATMDDVFVYLTGSTIDDQGQRIDEVAGRRDPDEVHRAA